MGSFPAIVQILGGTGAVVGFTWVVFRFIRWAVEFSCTRLDARDARVTAREADVEEKMAAWRVTMERDLRTLQLEVSDYRRATNLLVGELHKSDPSNPTLRMVDQILAPYRVVPLYGNDPDADLLRKMP